MTALRARGCVLQRTLETTFSDIDVAILPILADPLPTIAETRRRRRPPMCGGAWAASSSSRGRSTIWACRRSRCRSRASGGLPNGIQLIGRPYHEAQLFAIGQAYQREIPPQIARPV